MTAETRKRLGHNYKHMSDKFKKSYDELKFALEGKTEGNEDDTNNNSSDDFANSDNTSEGEVIHEVEHIVEEPKTEQKFMLNSEKREALYEAIPKQKSTDDDVNYYYWVMDFDDDFVYFEEETYINGIWETNYYRCSYTESDNEITVDESSKTEIVKRWLTVEEMEEVETKRDSEMMELNSKVEELTKKVEAFENDIKEKDTLISELQNYKNNVEVQIKEEEINSKLEEFEDDLKDMIARKIKQAEERAEDEAEEKAQYILVEAMQKSATDYVSETTTTTVKLPNEDMKGRIIGKEGRNIKAFEKLTGVDVLIDEVPGEVTLSSYDPLRREVATLALNKLMKDGRIHDYPGDYSYYLYKKGTGMRPVAGSKSGKKETPLEKKRRKMSAIEERRKKLRASFSKPGIIDNPRKAKRLFAEYQKLTTELEELEKQISITG